MKKKPALLAASLAASLAAAVMGLGAAAGSAQGATDHHAPAPSSVRTITGWLVTPHLGL